MSVMKQAISGLCMMLLLAGGAYPLVARADIFNPTDSSSFITSETVVLCVALGTETDNLTTGTAKYTMRAPFAFTITDVRASVSTAPTGATIIIDINDGGSTIMTTDKLSIDATEKTSTTAATAPGITDTAIADDAEITFDIDQVGSTIAGIGGKVCIIGTID